VRRAKRWNPAVSSVWLISRAPPAGENGNPREVRVGRHDHAEPRAAVTDEAVDQLRRGDHAAAAVEDVERERAMAADPGRAASVGADAALDDRCQRRFGRVAVLVQPGVDQQVELAGAVVGAAQAAGRRGLAQVQRATAEQAAARSRGGGGLNACAHGWPPARP
jgi:hypothetical protein